MGKVPYYLRYHLIRIRRHQLKEFYLRDHFETLNFKRAQIESGVLNELHKLDLIAVSDERLEKPFDLRERFGSFVKVPYPPYFSVTARGYYMIRESIISTFVSTSGALFLVGVGWILGRFF